MSGVAVPAYLRRWIESWVLLCWPVRVHVCDGTLSEYRRLNREWLGAGSASLGTKRGELRAEGDRLLWPLADPHELMVALEGCMLDRTLYVVPFALPLTVAGHQSVKVGVEITDQLSAVVALYRRAQVDQGCLERASTEPFFRVAHAAGHATVECPRPGEPGPGAVKLIASPWPSELWVAGEGDPCIGLRWIASRVDAVARVGAAASGARRDSEAGGLADARFSGARPRAGERGHDAVDNLE